MTKENTLFALIESLGGKTLGNDFEDIDEKISLKNQPYPFDEDMLLIKFENNFSLDVSWRERVENKGYFLVSIIHGCDWDNPLLRIRSHSFGSLKKAIKKAHAFLLSIKDIKRPLFCIHEPHD